MHWADDVYCVPYDEPEEFPEADDFNDFEYYYWQDYLLEEEADCDEDISILCQVCYINATTIKDLIDN